MAFILLFSVMCLVVSGGQAQSSPSSSTPPNLTMSDLESSPIPSSGSFMASSPMTPSDPSYYPSSPSSPSAPSTADDDAGIDEGDDGKAENLADYVMKKIENLISGGNDEDLSNAYEDQKNVTADPELKNCSLEATLDRYCGPVPDSVHAYFNHDVSVQGLLKSIFDPTIVDALQSNCAPGSWCLPDDFHQDILEGKEIFYTSSPFCSDAMWTCLQSMVDLRYDCEEEPLNYLVDVVLLLCDMEGVGDLQPECYTRTVEALYVSYADSIRQDSSHKTDLEKDDCNDYKVQMTRTYLCADDVCSFDQNLLLEKFSAWEGVADKAVGVAMTCNITRECQTDYDGEDDNDDYFDYYDYTEQPGEDEEEEYEEYKEEMEKIEEEIQKELADEENKSGETGAQDEYGSFGDGQVNANTGGSYEDQDRAMMFGLITMTTVLTLGLLSLAFMGYRRYRRGRHANYRRGYSQLADEEAKMLRNEYK